LRSKKINLTLRKYEIEEIYSKTPDDNKLSRANEILSWLKDKNEITNWAAIDDIDLLSQFNKYAAKMRGHFIKTNEYIGLTEEIADKIINMLNSSELTSN